MPASSVYRVTLDHGDGVTPIYVGNGVVERPPAPVEELVAGRQVLAVVARPVAELYPQVLKRLLVRAAVCERLVVRDGEAAKTPAAAERLWQSLLAAGGRRDSLLVACGGGTIGDLAGFVAATFLRGIDVLHVPTTLLAQVDAAIGGKTGINLPAAKNAVGAFHHPLAVVADPRFLATLAAAEVRSGLVEVIKMAALLDDELLARVERDLDRLLAIDVGALVPVVAAAARAKAEVVERDPCERGVRKLLNFGHTVGHAIEAAAGYRGLRHGEAVGWGIRFALRLAARRGLPGEERARLQALLDRLGLPPLPALRVEEVMSRMRHDKKSRHGGITWILPRRLGEGALVENVAESEVEAELRDFLTVHPPGSGL